MTTRAELETFLDEHEFTGTRRGDAAELAASASCGPGCGHCCTSDRDSAVGLVNELLGEEHALPRLVRHGGHDWHIHAVAPDAPLATRIVVETAMAMIDVIRADEMSRLDVCADPDCEASGARPVPQPVTAVLQHGVHQPGRRGGVPRSHSAEPLQWSRKRRSTSRNTAGCSECTQCPASLTVTSRLVGNQRPMAAADSGVT